MRSRSRRIYLPLVLACLLGGSWAAFGQGAAGQAKVEEEFQYRWRLRNFMGNLAGLFLPNQGEGSLTFRTDANGHLLSELTITAGTSAKHEGEYFRYGSEVDTRTLQPIRAWSAYSWRGETKSKSAPVREVGVLDVASGIYAIRKDPPVKARRMEIWSDGKIYPVTVIPLANETRTMRDGRKLDVRRYSIRGVEVPGRRKWKGKLDLWLTRDAAATPVEIVISRNLADVHMELKDLR
jgi:Protein of unknown function (DUF3108)